MNISDHSHNIHIRDVSKMLVSNGSAVVNWSDKEKKKNFKQSTMNPTNSSLHICSNSDDKSYSYVCMLKIER